MAEKTTNNQGGCLCGAIRYQSMAEPQRVTVCHCTFCQRITGSAFLVEPIFLKSDFELLEGKLHTYEHISDGSNKKVNLHYCERCATKIYMSFERFPEVIGLFGGTFDDLNWFERNAENCRHIFTQSIQKGVVLPAGIDIYHEHVAKKDGEPNKPVVFAHALQPR